MHCHVYIHFKVNLHPEYEWITQDKCTKLGKKQSMWSLFTLNSKETYTYTIVWYIHSKATYQLSMSGLHQIIVASWERWKHVAAITLILEENYAHSPFKGNLPPEYEWISQDKCTKLGKKQGM